MKGWWRDFFGERFAATWLRDDAAGERAARGIWDALGLRRGDRVFDQGCGVGRVALPLARLGAAVVGVDASAPYIDEARRRGAGLSATFHCEDFFTFQPPGTFDAALSWHTSFGYAEDDTLNRAALMRAFEALRPGGSFVLDYPDMARVQERFRPTHERHVETPDGPVRIERRARLDSERGMLVDEWRFEGPGGVERAWGETRLYDETQLRSLLASVGFGRIERLSAEALGYARGEAALGRLILRADRKDEPLRSRPGVRPFPSNGGTPPFSRAALYAGEVQRRAASAASRGLVEIGTERLEQAFTHCADSTPFFECLTAARLALAEDPDVRGWTARVLAELGVDADQFLVDAPRLRGVAPGGHRDPLARDAYAIHRDTWYANPRAQINLWIPLQRVGTDTTLSLFPAHFTRAIENDSARFDFDAFQRAGGFQAPAARGRAAFPRAHVAPQGEVLRPALEAAEVLLFSGHHLHGPTPHDASAARFSLDLRIVHRRDHQEGRGAIEVDNESRGDASAGYTFLEAR